MKALITSFELPDFDTQKILESSEKGVNNYLKRPGLVYKAYLLNPEAKKFGAVYLFENEQTLNEFVTSDRWKNQIPAIWGVAPTASDFDVPILVDNTRYKVIRPGP
ncbi:YdhR family protein [Mycobacterium sp. SM1]|uniref:YdhR family protein n=1 Tax=Mycobacterium sp. SM1 TaxID=2816243 RepID=UPI001BCE86E3|nr:YdhR family protein [Mycobacterium sp. SM1]MBS4730352.1 YdhR family protein [Mycobacterium sp. SM1]